MKIYFSPASPFVRKVMVTAHELGLAEAIERLPSAAHPVNRDRSIVAENPLGKVPTLVTDDGHALYDSRVICEYLNARAGGALFPPAGEARWRALTEQALGDGILDAAVLTRYESVVRPEERRWSDWVQGQLDKVDTALEALEQRASSFGERVDIGTITLGCALGYLDFRFGERDWRKPHPRAAGWFARFGQRPSMQATLPQG